jgi:hypothetical protein
MFGLLSNWDLAEQVSGDLFFLLWRAHLIVAFGFLHNRALQWRVR